MQRPVVLLPQPDSPTRPSVSPASRSKLTPLTACTLSTSRPSQPPVIGKRLTRSLTSSSGAVIGRSMPASRRAAVRRRNTSKMQRTLWPGTGSRSAGVAATHSGTA